MCVCVKTMPWFFFNFILFLNFTILYGFCQISKWIRHSYTCVPHPEPSSLPMPWIFKMSLLVLIFEKHCHRGGLTDCSCTYYMPVELAQYTSNFVFWDGSGNCLLIWGLPFTPAWKERLMAEVAVDRQWPH